MSDVQQNSQASTAAGDGKEETLKTTARRIDDNLVQHIVQIELFGRTFPTSNVWVLHDGGEALLVDAGFGDEASSNARLEYFRKEFSHLDFKYIVITHHHFDHSSGGRRLREGLRAETAINPIDEELLHTPTTSNEDLPDEEEISKRAQIWREEALATPIDRTLADGETVRVGGLTVRAVHTPGHTAGHNCYFVEERGILFTGDNVLGIGTSAIAPPPHGDMEQYLQSLVRMRELQSTLIAPGHGPTVTATGDKIQELLDHRAVRDRQILDLVERGYTTDTQIRRFIYPELEKARRRAARGQIRSHIARLVGMGELTVTERDKTWEIARTK